MTDRAGRERDEAAEAGSVWTTARYLRHSPGLEFDRTAVFADAVYAIALTLIIVTVEVPTVDAGGSASALLEGLRDVLPKIVMFFVAFFLLGSYWLSHHRFVRTLRAVDSRFLVIQLVYLAFVAFLPFPASVLGSYDENPIAVTGFALTMAVISGLEAVLFAHAQRADLFIEPLRPDSFRWALMGSLSPVVVFLVAIPLGFVATWLAIAAFFLTVPIGVWLDRRRPSDFGLPPDSGAVDAPGA